MKIKEITTVEEEIKLGRLKKAFEKLLEYTEEKNDE